MQVNERSLLEVYMKYTKENILLAALELFSANGYEATSVSDIASKLGITKGALYKHYKSKRDIFDSILERMERYDAEGAKDFDLPEDVLAEAEEKYRSAKTEDVIDFALDRFRYWTQEEFPCMFRKMLTLEQYRSEEMSRLYNQYLVSGPLEYTVDLFVSNGTESPVKKATELYSAMFLYYGIYDGAKDKSKAISAFEEHIDSLAESWGVPKKETRE